MPNATLIQEPPDAKIDVDAFADLIVSYYYDRVQRVPTPDVLAALDGSAQIQPYESISPIDQPDYAAAVDDLIAWVRGRAETLPPDIEQLRRDAWGRPDTE